MEHLDHVASVFAATLVAHLFMVPTMRRFKELLAWMHRRVQKTEHASGLPIEGTPPDLAAWETTDPGMGKP